MNSNPFQTFINRTNEVQMSLFLFFDIRCCCSCCLGVGILEITFGLADAADRPADREAQPRSMRARHPGSKARPRPPSSTAAPSRGIG